MRGQIREQLTNHRVWLEKNGHRIEERDRQYLDRDLEDGSPQASRLLTISLDSLATVYGTRGVVQVADATGDGWAEIARAIDYWGWSLQIRTKEFFGVPAAFAGINLTNVVSLAACLICCSESWSATAGAILRRMASVPHAVDPSYWAQRRFEPFVLACLDWLDGGKPPDIAGLESPYREVIESWREERRLRDALSAVCDYHINNIDDMSEEWDHEFKHPPFDLLPCELMLVHELRIRSGNPSLNDFPHPLVQTLGRISRLKAMATGDRLLGQVEEFFVRCYR